MYSKLNRGEPFADTTTHATAAVATVAGVAGYTHYITDISGSTDKAGAILTVKQGTTTIWEVQLAATAAGNLAYSHSFNSPLVATKAELVSVTIDGTSVCKANIAGYTV